jgi:hypothetical protein
MPAASFLGAEDPLQFADVQTDPIYIDEVYQSMQE